MIVNLTLTGGDFGRPFNFKMDTSTTMTVKTALYRHFDAKNNLLYVGISLSAVARLSQHSTLSAWFDDIARVDVVWFDTREKALEEERRAVAQEKPIYNKRLQTVIKDLPQQRDEPRKAITHKIVVLNPVYKINEAAQVLNISESTLRQKIEQNEIGAMLLGEVVKKNSNGNETTAKRYQISGWQLLDYIEYLERR
jgi:excisionase family DNA binding protein